MMVFGVISEQGPICFTIVPQKTKINQDTYQEMLKTHVLPRIRKYESQPGGIKIVFMQNGASSFWNDFCHTFMCVDLVGARV